MILSWQQIPSPLISEIMCHNFDGVVLDTEHGCYSNETLYSCIQVIKCSEKKCFVRLTEVSNTMIRYCLDAGVDGLIFSSVETREQCEKIIEYCYYSPKGKRGLGLVRQNMWGEKDLIQPSPIIIPQIETKTAVDNLKEITQFSFDKVYDSIPKEKIDVHIPNDVKNELLKYKDCGLKCLGMDTIALINYNKEILNYVEF